MLKGYGFLTVCFEMINLQGHQYNTKKMKMKDLSILFV